MSLLSQGAEDSAFGDSSVEVKKLIKVPLPFSFSWSILKQVNQFSKLTNEGVEAVSLSVSAHGEEADGDLSPRSISMLEAEEGRDGKQVHHLLNNYLI